MFDLCILVGSDRFHRSVAHDGKQQVAKSTCHITTGLKLAARGRSAAAWRLSRAPQLSRGVRPSGINRTVALEVTVKLKNIEFLIDGQVT